MRTSSLVESWLQPGTALARAFKGFLTRRPLCHHGANFLHGLQLHQGYYGQKDFSTWAGKNYGPVPPVELWTPRWVWAMMVDLQRPQGP